MSRKDFISSYCYRSEWGYDEGAEFERDLDALLRQEFRNGVAYARQSAKDAEQIMIDMPPYVLD